MRPIKFRAWDKEKREMKYPYCMIWHDDGDFSISLNGGEDYLGKNDIEIMQFTGLIDKNRKEIYEGDIFLAWFPGMRNNMRATQLVQYKDGCFNSGGMPLYLITKSTLEVIGNAYENPELLSKN